MAKARTRRASTGARRMTTGEAAVAALSAHGLDTIYVLPGVHNDDFFDVLAKTVGSTSTAAKIRTVHTRHEQGAAYMALGAALATGKPQAYCVVPGPGLLNSAAALLTAYGMNAPVLALFGQIPQHAIGRGLAHLHEIRDQAGIIARLVDWSERIRAPHEAPRLIAEAIRSMFTGRPGPAALECAIDVWGRSGPVLAQAPLPVPEPPIDEDAIKAAAKLPRRRQKTADRGRRRRAGRRRRGDAPGASAAGAGRVLSARPRRDRRPRPARRQPAARSRTVGRGGRGARRRHPPALPGSALGNRSRPGDRPRRRRSRGARAPGQARLSR